MVPIEIHNRKLSKARETRHKPTRARDHAELRWVTGWPVGGGEDAVLAVRSGSWEGESSEYERRRVEVGEVMEEERREDDMTSYLNLSENSWPIEWWFCTEVTMILRNWKWRRLAW
jgi:hypothetical protein